MTNKILLFLLAVTVAACSTSTPKDIYSFSEEITESSLYSDLAVLADDSLQGRETGTIGEEKAARYLSKRYTEMGLKAVGDNDTYFQHYKVKLRGTEDSVATKNVVAFLEGSDPQMKDEVVVLSSHYDHVGVGRPDSTGDTIYNGADDDGRGTTATLQVAEAMAKAKAAGVGPKRSVLFLNVSGEEKGLLGSYYYSENPLFSIENTVANINIDMIGRVDPEHQNGDSSYVYVIGNAIISSQMDSLTRIANDMGPNLDLSDRYNDLNDPNQFYRRSDHWNFGRLGVPFVFFFNGTHEDYHRPQDHIEKITFEPYLKRTHLVYNLTAILANSPNRPLVDNQEFIEKTQVNPR